MRRFRALIKKELTHMRRDPRTLIFVFMMPILQLVLLGYVNNTDFTNIPTVVFNQDNGPASRQLLDAFQGTGYFAVRLCGVQPIRGEHPDRRRTGEGGDRHPAGLQH